jgi:hypothetical protein
MARSLWSLPLTFVCCALAAGELVAQARGPLATPTERLDDLLSQWRDQTVAHLREVWGREQETEMRGQSPVLVYEKRVKVRTGFGTVTMHPGGGVLCVVRFLIDDGDMVARTARQGSGQECWEQWRRYEP